MKASITPKDKQVQQCEEIISLLNNEETPNLKTLSQSNAILSYIAPVQGCSHIVCVKRGEHPNLGMKSWAYVVISCQIEVNTSYYIYLCKIAKDVMIHEIRNEQNNNLLI